MALVAGAVFWSEKASKNLTRESAGDKIEEYLRINPQKTESYGFDEQLGHYYVRFSDPDYMLYGEDEVKLIKTLEAAGFTKIVGEKNFGSRFMPGPYNLYFDFTELAKPYFVKREDAASNNKNFDILLAEVVNVEVTGLTEPAMKNGASIRTANYVATYRATPIGKIIDEEKATKEIRSTWQFTLYDDGWRIAR